MQGRHLGHLRALHHRLERPHPRHLLQLTDIITGATWQTTTPTLHVGRWNDIWEVRVDPFHLSKALAHVTLVVDMDRLNDEGGRALIALGILEAVEACGRASEMVERLDGAYIYDDDWDEEGLPWRAWGNEADSSQEG